MNLTLDLFGDDLSPAPAVASVPSVPAPPAQEQQGQQGQLHAHMYAFIAVARHAGLIDPALEPVAITEAGRRVYDDREVARLANEILRGVRSDMPPMTIERWGQAIRTVRGTK